MISPAQRYETAAVNALSAALWSSHDADRMFATHLQVGQTQPPEQADKVDR